MFEKPGTFESAYRLAQGIQDYTYKQALKYGIDKNKARALAIDIGKAVMERGY